MLEYVPEQKNKKQSYSIKYRALLFTFVLLIQILILFMYGFFAQYSNSNINYLPYIFTNLLAAIGFGLVLSYLRFGIKQSLVIILFVISLNLQFAPLLQKFWSNVFIDGFSQENNKIILNFDSFRISTFCSISLLIALSGVIGKITVFPFVLSTILFNVGFFLNYTLNAKILADLQQTTQIYDDLHGSRIFMFAIGFGLGLVLLYSKYRPVQRKLQRDHNDQQNSLTLFFGVLVILCSSFFLIDNIVTTSFTILTIFITLSASSITALGISCLINGKIWLKDLMLSTLSGLIQISFIISFIKHPFVGIIIGAYSALVSSFFLNLFDWKINGSKIRDTIGIFSFYCVNALLGLFMVTPIILSSYNENDDPNQDWNVGHPMIFGSISLGIGLVFGLISGLFAVCFKNECNLSDMDFFGKNFQNKLKSESQAMKSVSSEVKIDENDRTSQLRYKNKSQIQTFEDKNITSKQELGSEIKLF